MLYVFFYCLGVDYEVVQVDMTSLPFELGKHEVQCALKLCRWVCLPECNSVLFSRPRDTNERGFVFIFFFKWNMPIFRVFVQVFKYIYISNGFNTFFHTWQWKTIFNGILVELPVIYENPWFSVFLGHEENWWEPIVISRLDHSSFKLLRNL